METRRSFIAKTVILASGVGVPAGLLSKEYNADEIAGSSDFDVSTARNLVAQNLAYQKGSKGVRFGGRTQGRFPHRELVELYHANDTVSYGKIVKLFVDLDIHA